MRERRIGGMADGVDATMDPMQSSRLGTSLDRSPRDTDG
jgi:hypothetical protein